MDTTIPVIILIVMMALAIGTLIGGIITLVLKKLDTAIVLIALSIALFICSYTFVSILALLQQHGKI